MLLIDAELMALELMVKHNLSGWKFNFNRAKRFLGFCYPNQKIIELSASYVQNNSTDEVKKTIIHEIAHALTPGHHYDYTWKLKCIELGISPNRLHNAKDIVIQEGKYKAFCPTCQDVKGTFHRKVKRNYICRVCRSTLIIKE